MATMRKLGIVVAAIATIPTSPWVVVACSANSSSDYRGGSASGGSGIGYAGNAGSAGVFNIGGSGSTDNPNCNSSANQDFDGDGYTIAQGDCNDCSAQTNPGAFDFLNNNVDEDCSGTADDEPTACEANLPIEGDDAMDAARALGLCRTAVDGAEGKKRTWGVLSAAYVFADGSNTSQWPHDLEACASGYGNPPNPASRGILTSFGDVVVPSDGEAMVALSTGIARSGVNGTSPANGQMCTLSATPPYFPTPSTEACPGHKIDDTGVAHDPMALELRIRTPTNAQSMSFDFDFYTYEYPNYICSSYNDFFVALVESQHPTNPQNKNISFDRKGNSVSVNNGFLEVCEPGFHGGKQFSCLLGTEPLMGTGFEGHGATGWLQTQAPIIPGEEITIRFAIWDMGDESLDSTVLLDNVQWDVDEGETGTVRLPPK